MNRFGRSGLVALCTLALSGCDSEVSTPELGFLGGTREDPQIGLVVNSTGKALTLFQLGSPTTQAQIPFGASEAITPVGMSVGGTRAAVPLGNAASVAIVDLQTQSVSRVFLFPGGNATGSAWVDEKTVLAANMPRHQVGRFTLDQAGDTIRQTVNVANTPSKILVHNGRAFVISSNLDEKFAPIGNGVVTALDPRTLQVLGTVQTGGTNANDAEIGPDGLLYVVNTHRYDKGSLTVIDPQSLRVVHHQEGFGAGPGSISIDRNGMAYISGFFFGTLVWNTRTRQFVRGPDNPVCAPLAEGRCRGAPDAQTDQNGNLYQVFFGSARQGLKPWVFKYRASTFELTDSIAVGQGPFSIEIRRF